MVWYGMVLYVNVIQSAQYCIITVVMRTQGNLCVWGMLYMQVCMISWRLSPEDLDDFRQRSKLSSSRDMAPFHEVLVGLEQKVLLGLSTFKTHWWFNKPLAFSALAAARRGTVWWFEWLKTGSATCTVTWCKLNKERIPKITIAHGTSATS